MKVFAIVVAAAVAVKADTPAFCADADVLKASSNDADVVICGATTNTNCANWAKDAFCAPWSSEGTLYSVCCDNSDGDSDDAAAINEFKNCGDCLDSDNNDGDDTNVWDGENCYAFGSAASDGIAYWRDPSVFSTQVFVTSQDECPENCHRLEFTGTCWKRCGARGWGIDASLYTGVYGNAYGYNNGMSPYGMSPYGMSPYGMSPYGFSPYGFSPYGFNPYGQQLNFGSVPSVSGAPCPDPKSLYEIEKIDLPVLPPMLGLGGLGMGSMGFGFPLNYGLGLGGVYGRQFNTVSYGSPLGMGYGSTLGMGYGSTLGMGYGSTLGMGYGSTMGMGYGYGSTMGYPQASIYGATTTIATPIASSTVYASAPVSSVYTPSAAVLPSTAASIYAAPTTEKARCDPVFQCSCDTKCCARGDCCADFDDEGCNIQY